MFPIISDFRFLKNSKNEKEIEYTLFGTHQTPKTWLLPPVYKEIFAKFTIFPAKWIGIKRG